MEDNRDSSGSGKSYMSASAAAKQMSLEASAGNMEKMTPISSGFKFLEYEHKHRSDDWRLLGDFLTEEVRYFKARISMQNLSRILLLPSTTYDFCL